MKWILASDRLGDFKDSDIPHWKFFNCDFAKVDGKPVERPYFKKDIEVGKIVFSYKEIYDWRELPESEFHRIVWLDEQDEEWSFNEDQVKDAMKYAAENNLLFTKTDEQIDRLYDIWLKTLYPQPPRHQRLNNS